MPKTNTASAKKSVKKTTAKKTTAKKTTAKKTNAKKIVAKKAVKKAVAKKAPQKIANNKSKIAPYKSKKNEKYMSAAMKRHFVAVLLLWKEHLLDEMQKTFDHLKAKGETYADPVDRASQEEEFAFELRTRDRERKLISKIAVSLEKIKQDDYGWCDACGCECCGCPGVPEQAAMVSSHHLLRRMRRTLVAARCPPRQLSVYSGGGVCQVAPWECARAGTRVCSNGGCCVRLVTLVLAAHPVMSGELHFQLGWEWLV